MPDIRYPDGAGEPFVSGQPARPPRTAGHDPAAAQNPEPPEDLPWQTAVVRVSTMVAVWLGY